MSKKQIFSAKVCCVCGIGILLCLLYATIISPVPEVVVGYENIITIRELQQQLVDRGAKIKVDGICGWETLAAWERQMGNDWAIPFFEKAEN